MARIAKVNKKTVSTKTTKDVKTKDNKKEIKAKEPKTKEVKDTKVEKKIKPGNKTYNVFFNGADMNTHPAGKQPKQAARKAITPIFASIINAKKDPKKVATIEKFLDKTKKTKDGKPKETEKYKTEMKSYEEELSKEFLGKYFLFYLIQKRPRIKREYRHYYYGTRQPVNPKVESYLSIVDPSLSKEEKEKYKKEHKKLPKITIDEKDFKGELIKDKNGNVIEVKIPHHKTRFVLDKNGKRVLDENGKPKKEKIPGEEPRIISRKYENVVAKLTREFYDQHKADFNLTPEQEQELMDHFNHKKPKKIETKREIKAREAKEAARLAKKAKEAAKKEANKEKKKAAKEKEKEKKKAAKAKAKEKKAEKKAAAKKKTEKKVEKKVTPKKKTEKKDTKKEKK